MKNLLLIFMCGLAVSSCISGDEIAKKDLKSSIETSNKDCPIEIAEGIVMDSIVYNDPNVAVFYTIKDGKYDAESFKNNISRAMADSISTSTLSTSLQRNNAALVININDGNTVYSEKYDFKSNN